jgi:hypothetical protein
MTSDRTIYRAIYWLTCLILAAVFLFGVQKLVYPADFALAVYRFHLLPDAWVNPVAIYLPWLEITVAVCLLFVPKWRTAALWMALALLVLFTVAIAINLLRGSAFGCGCFSASPAASPMSWLSIVRNIALLTLSWVALKRRSKM